MIAIGPNKKHTTQKRQTESFGQWIAFIFAARAQLAWYMAKDQNKGELTISVDFRFNFDGLKEKNTNM